MEILVPNILNTPKIPMEKISYRTDRRYKYTPGVRLKLRASQAIVHITDIICAIKWAWMNRMSMSSLSLKFRKMGLL